MQSKYIFVIFVLLVVSSENTAQIMLRNVMKCGRITTIKCNYILQCMDLERSITCETEVASPTAVPRPYSILYATTACPYGENRDIKGRCRLIFTD